MVDHLEHGMAGHSSLLWAHSREDHLEHEMEYLLEKDGYWETLMDGWWEWV